jgi:PBSX family phage terminase large subunit
VNTKVIATKEKGGFELRGDARKLISATEPEAILSGPADTGKTVACCIKAHLIALRCAGSQGAIVRKSSNSLTGSVLQTFARVTKGQGYNVFGGTIPTRYLYKNGSVIWLGGMDNPAKILSVERDFIYVNQAEELTLNDWETLATRCSGRAATVKHPQLFGDCNPGGSQHWIRQRAAKGKLRLLVALHKDNPSMFTATGKLTASGERRMAVLENLTGLRKLRLKDGIWATAEGAVYDTFNSVVHVHSREQKEMKRFFLAMDEGYTNPAVILVIGEDSDGRWHCFKEYYEKGKLQSAVVMQAREWWDNYDCQLIAVDESAAGLIADLNAAGMNAIGGKGRVIDGIQLVQNRLAVQGDKLPRYSVDPSCVNHINEFESYVWAEGKAKDTPVKENDHSLDAVRYLEDVMAVPTGAFGSTKGVHTGNAVEDSGGMELEVEDLLGKEILQEMDLGT